MSQVRNNEKIIAKLTSGGSVDRDLSMQFDLAALQHILEAPGDLKLSRKQKAAMEERCRALQAGSRQASLLANRGEEDGAASIPSSLSTRMAWWKPMCQQVRVHVQ